MRKIAKIIFALVCSATNFALADATALYKQGTALYATDPIAAYPLFVQAAEQGSVAAMNGVAHCCKMGTGTAVDYSKTINWYEKAVEHKSMEACKGLASVYASCPNPEFHDGKKAIKYASAYVRKYPRSAEPLILLAAAQARNLEFKKAVQNCMVAKVYASKKDRITLDARVAEYKRGIPYPPVVTDQWLLRAVENDNSWAIIKLARMTSDSHSRLFNPQLSHTICQKGIDAEIAEMYYIKAGLYLKSGELDKAYSHYHSVKQLKHGDQNGRSSCGSYLSSFINEPLPKILEYADKKKSGYVSISLKRKSPNLVSGYGPRGSTLTPCRSTSCDGANCGDCIITIKEEVQHPPNAKDAYFLYMVAAAKGSEAAKNYLSKIEQAIFAYQDILKSAPDKPSQQVAGLLVKEAKKHTTNTQIPRNLEVAAKLYQEAFNYHASGETAYELGRLYLSSRYGHDTYNGIKWLTIADSVGESRSARLLIREYAYCKKSSLMDGELALQYALELAENSPEDDEVNMLLASAYAQNGQYREAQISMQKALELQPNNYMYKKMQQEYKQNKPWRGSGTHYLTKGTIVVIE